LEFECTYHARPGITGFLGYGLSYGRYLGDEASADNEAILNNSPTHVLSCGLSVPIEGIGICAVDMRYESARLSAQDTYSDPFILFNARFVSAPLLEHFRLALQARNLLDTRYALPASAEYRQVFLPQPGRVISADILVSF
jgi:outer membrane receptor protein involved in Fe transport